MERFKEWWSYHYKHVYLIGGCILGVILLLGFVFFKIYFVEKKESNSKKESLVIEKKDDEKVIEVVNNVVVDIKGAVISPGIYYVSSNSRVSDVINLAGGTSGNADTSVINLSRKVFDEMVIIVYTKDEVNDFVKVKEEEAKKQEACIIIEEKIVNDACIYEKDLSNSNNSVTNSENIKEEEKTETNEEPNSGIVNINQATIDELMSLSGIGESKAKLIIEYRDINNGFKTIDELKNIKGIGDSIFDKIKDHITV